jgi:hypothetical protein
MGAVQYFASPPTITVNIATSASTISSGQQITLTASFPGGIPNYGVVTFTDTTTSTTLGGSPLYVNPAFSDVLLLTLSGSDLTTAGAHTITANYRALNDIGSSTSSPVTVTVGGGGGGNNVQGGGGLRMGGGFVTN